MIRELLIAGSCMVILASVGVTIIESVQLHELGAQARKVLATERRSRHLPSECASLFLTSGWLDCMGVQYEPQR